MGPGGQDARSQESGPAQGPLPALTRSPGWACRDLPRGCHEPHAPRGHSGKKSQEPCFPGCFQNQTAFPSGAPACPVRGWPTALPLHVPGLVASLWPLHFAEEEMLREGGTGVMGHGPVWHPTLVACLGHPTSHSCPTQHHTVLPSTAQFTGSRHPHSPLIGRSSLCPSSEKAPPWGTLIFSVTWTPQSLVTDRSLPQQLHPLLPL